MVVGIAPSFEEVPEDFMEVGIHGLGLAYLLSLLRPHSEVVRSTLVLLNFLKKLSGLALTDLAF